jgi:carbamoyl-phosphate synthase large subunit
MINLPNPTSNLVYKIAMVTTIAGAKATAAAIKSLQSQPLEVKALQDYIGLGRN